jgi:hypothetical protein
VEGEVDARATQAHAVFQACFDLALDTGVTTIGIRQVLVALLERSSGGKLSPEERRRVRTALQAVPTDHQAEAGTETNGTGREISFTPEAAATIQQIRSGRSESAVLSELAARFSEELTRAGLHTGDLK